jgi:hypothetical protein
MEGSFCRTLTGLLGALDVMFTSLVGEVFPPIEGLEELQQASAEKAKCQAWLLKDGKLLLQLSHLQGTAEQIIAIRARVEANQKMVGELSERINAIVSKLRAQKAPVDSQSDDGIGDNDEFDDYLQRLQDRRSH